MYIMPGFRRAYIIHVVVAIHNKRMRTCADTSTHACVLIMLYALQNNNLHIIIVGITEYAPTHQNMFTLVIAVYVGTLLRRLFNDTNGMPLYPTR